jgi:hypothetical protein
MHIHSLHIRRLPHRAVFTSRQRQLLPRHMLPTRQLHMIGRLSQFLPTNARFPGAMNGNLSAAMTIDHIKRPRSREAIFTLVPMRHVPRSH